MSVTGTARGSKLLTSFVQLGCIYPRGNASIVLAATAAPFSPSCSTVVSLLLDELSPETQMVGSMREHRENQMVNQLEEHGTIFDRRCYGGEGASHSMYSAQIPSTNQGLLRSRQFRLTVVKGDIFVSMAH